MAYSAVVAWCFSFHWIAGIFCLGACLGVESGRKTAYPVFLMVAAGLMTAALFALAIGGVMGLQLGYVGGAIKIMERGNSLAGNSGSTMVVLDGLLWICALASLVWFIRAWSTVGTHKPADNRHRIELETIVKEKHKSADQSCERQ